MNSNATYRIVLDTRRPLQDGRFPVKLRLTYRRKPKLYKTPYYLTEEDFQKVQNAKKQPTDASLRKLRVKFRDIETEVEAIILDFTDFSFQKFEAIYYTQKEQKHVKDLDYYYSLIKNDNTLSLSTKELTQNSYMAVQKGLGLSTLKGVEIGSMSVDKLKQIAAYLLEQGRSETTVSMYMGILRKIFILAIKDGLIDKEQYPFGKSLYKQSKVRKRKMPLNREDLRRLIQFDAGGNNLLQEAKDFFLLGFYLDGINMKDILLLKNANIKSGYLRFFREKTRSTSGTISEYATKIAPQAEEIISRHRQMESSDDEAYVFNVVKNKMSEIEKRNAHKNFTRKINDHLESIAKICGIEGNLTTGVARHSWVSHVSVKIGIEETRLRIGHTDLRSTQHYIASLIGKDEVINFTELLEESE